MIDIHDKTHILKAHFYFNSLILKLIDKIKICIEHPNKFIHFKINNK